MVRRLWTFLNARLLRCKIHDFLTVPGATWHMKSALMPNSRLPFWSRPIRFACALGLFFAFLICAAPGRAQDLAAISGRVTDPSGAAVAGAAVAARNDETGASRSATTDEGGLYSIAYLPVGGYEIQVTRKDFKQAVHGGIHLSVGQEAIADIALE